ncbi:alpha/beta fold hydrolase, partial [Paenibacillus aceti]
MSTKKKSRFWIITKNTVLFIMATVFIWIVFHLALTAHEQEKYPPLGQLVKVDGRHMHIYTKGDGKHTMVLLSGLGTAAPALDFEPLINELAINNKVVVVELFGYGWSSLTNKERTVENIVEELRTALHQASIEVPYILMPHSISGIYSMYYANKYPEEVKAVIGIDPTLPQALQYFGESAPTMPQYMGYISLTGVSRLATYINPKNYLPIAEEGTYSEDNLTMTRAISAWKGYNKNVIDEINEIKNNVDKTAPLKF